MFRYGRNTCREQLSSGTASRWPARAQGSNANLAAALAAAGLPQQVAGAMVARLSGSGSTVFGLFEGSPSLVDLHGGASAIATMASARVVQVEVQE